MAELRSARVEALEKAAVDEPAAAVDALRSDLAAARGPLIERVGGDETGLLVTFVWIGGEGPVSVRTPLIPGRVSSHPMTRVANTEVWCLSARADPDVVSAYQFVVDDPLLRLEPGRKLVQDPETMLRLVADAASHSFADPFNPHRVLPESSALLGADALPPDRWSSVLVLPEAERMPWFDAEPAECGALETHQLVSDVFGNERRITVYTPPSYSTGGAPYPLVVLLDGESMLDIAQMHVALDNLIGAGELPAVVAAFVHNATPFSRMVEMACHPGLPTLLADELLPLVRSRYRVTADPAKVVLGGASYGGLGSAYAAFERPDAFGNVLSCSGSHWWGYANEPDAVFSLGRDGEPEWLTRQYAAAERKRLRFWIDTGRLETGVLDEAPGIDHRASSRHLRTVLVAKGYDVTYYEAPGAHQTVVFRRSIVKGLKALL